MLSPEYHEENNPLPKDGNQTLMISSHSPKWCGLKSRAPFTLHSPQNNSNTSHRHPHIPTVEQVKPSRRPETYDLVQRRTEINS